MSKLLSAQSIDSLNLHLKDSVFNGNNIPIAQSFSVDVENYQYNLLNLSFPNYDVLVSRFHVYDSLPEAGNFRIGFNNYKNYLELSSNNLVLDTGRSISRLNVVLGTKREQLLFLDHKQRIGKNILAGISYNSIVSEGFLLHQFSKVKVLSANLNFNQKGYSLYAMFSSNKVLSEENGGIVSGQVTNDISKSDFNLLQIKLTDAQRNARKQKMILNQSFNISKFFQNIEQTEVNENSIKLNINSSYTVDGYSYSGSNDSGFYMHTYLDTVSTFDSSSVKEFVNGIGIVFEHKSVVPDLFFSIQTGFTRHDINLKVDTLKSNFEYYVPSISINLHDKFNSLNSSISTVSGGNSASGDLTLRIHGKRKFENIWINYFGLNFISSSNSAAAITENYISNHFLWNNDFDKKEKCRTVIAEAGVVKNIFNLFGSFTTYSNKIYFDNQALPNQLSDAINISSVGISATFFIKKINIYFESKFQQTDNKIIPVPDYTVYSRIAYRSRFFNDALKAEFGVSGIYTAAYFANAYMPATGQYYLQNDQEIAGVPTLNVFSNLVIGPAILTFKIENVNHGIFGGENYIAPGYPVPPRTLKFGLKWMLYN